VAYSIDAGAHVFLFYLKEFETIINIKLAENDKITTNVNYISTSIDP
jgi:mevalonate pyrophosphate decarboxylase